MATIHQLVERREALTLLVRGVREPTGGAGAAAAESKMTVAMALDRICQLSETFAASKDRLSLQLHEWTSEIAGACLDIRKKFPKKSEAYRSEVSSCIEVHAERLFREILENPLKPGEVLANPVLAAGRIWENHDLADYSSLFEDVIPSPYMTDQCDITFAEPHKYAAAMLDLAKSLFCRDGASDAAAAATTALAAAAVVPEEKSRKVTWYRLAAMKAASRETARATIRKIQLASKQTALIEAAGRELSARVVAEARERGVAETRRVTAELEEVRATSTETRQIFETTATALRERTAAAEEASRVRSAAISELEARVDRAAAENRDLRARIAAMEDDDDDSCCIM